MTCTQYISGMGPNQYNMEHNGHRKEAKGINGCDCKWIRWDGVMIRSSALMILKLDSLMSF
jgi:hypothetical protein